MKTNKDYSVNFKHYGEITVPEGTPVTHQTAIGIDEKYHFVNSFEWIDLFYPQFAQLLKHDAFFYGIYVWHTLKQFGPYLKKFNPIYWKNTKFHTHLINGKG